MSTPVEQIKDRLPIEEVVGSYVKLSRAGANLKAKCPFHNERTPSFFVSPARGSFYCFGCGAKGDIFSFVEQFEGLDFAGTLRVLAARAGVELRSVPRRDEEKRERLYRAMEAASAFFEGELAKAPLAREYLANRGLSEKTIREWRIGFAPSGWRNLFDELSKSGFREPELLEAGLVKRSAAAEGGHPYDTFRGRIMFPIFDGAGRVVAFSGRVLPGGEDPQAEAAGPKYVNSPETPLWTKSRMLYGFDRAKNKIRTAGYAILVEGQMDLLMAHQSSFSNAVASSGTSLTEEQVALIRRFTDNLLFAFDADAAGLGASERGVKLALAAGCNVKVAILPPGEDPASLLAKAPARFRESVRGAKHIVTVLLESALSLSDGVKRSRTIERRVLPFVATLKSRLEQSHFVKEIAKVSGLREEALWETLARVSADGGAGAAPSEGPVSAAGERPSDPIARKLFAVLFLKERESGGSELRAALQRILGAEFDSLHRRFGSESDALLFEAEEVKEGEAEKLLVRLEGDRLKKKAAALSFLMKNAEGKGDEGRVAELLAEYDGISRKLRALQRGSERG